MAAKGLEMDRETFTCTICSELLKKPVTIPCGHSYCMSCINTHWNEEAWEKSYSCPQCRQKFPQRPVLVKNMMLATLMEGFKKTAAPTDKIYAAHGDVGCDMCSGRKVKAVKSCLVCRMSYCKDHLKSHYNMAALKRHKLLKPTENIHSICSQHNETMKLFCRTDQQCVCYICSVEKCKGHDIVTTEAERTERQGKIAIRQQKVRQRFEEKQKLVETIKEETNIINHFADLAIEETDILFYDVTTMVATNRINVNYQIGSIQFIERVNVMRLQDRLQREISKLKRKHSALEKYSQTENDNHFIHNFKSLSQLDEQFDEKSGEHSGDDSEDEIIEKSPMPFFGHVLTTALSELKDIYTSVSRDELLHFARDVTLNPNTLHNFYSLSDGNRKLRASKIKRTHHRHPERFDHFRQVLSREPLTGRCYIELNANYNHKSSRLQTFTVALAYKDILRKGPSFGCKFGKTSSSWALVCYSSDDYIFLHKNFLEDVFTEPSIEKMGIYLDHEAGILAFYRLNEPQSLIHEVRTTFTKPLYLGLSFEGKIDSLEICKLR